MKNLYLTALLSALTLSAFAEPNFSWGDHYEISNIPNPPQADTQVGGLALMKNGELAACFHRGEVMFYNPESKKWRVFATGLHEPLGIYVEDEGTLLVIQRAELTRLHDKDGDGLADFHEVVCNDWGLTGNYHEFAFGLVKDSKKNIYIALGTASSGSGVREEIRGLWNDTGGLTHDTFLYGGKHGSWEKKKKIIPRMYARVPYRGCVLKIEPGSPKAHVYATGLRTPNGLYMDADDQLWVSDNQGDWLGASKLHRIQPGKFHGHAASLLWGENPPKVTPAKLPVEELERRRTKSASLMPQGDCANSLTQIFPYRKEFGASAEAASKNLIIGDMNHSRLVQYLPDTVNGNHQGAATHLIATESLGIGNNRFAYTADGKSLYVGKTHLSWAGHEGLKLITFTGKPYLQAESLTLTKKGFKFRFNSAITIPKSACKIQSYRIDYHARYGSKNNDLESEPCSKVIARGNELIIELENELKPNRVYDITLPAEIKSELSYISSTRFWYTAHEVRK